MLQFLKNELKHVTKTAFVSVGIYHNVNVRDVRKPKNNVHECAAGRHLINVTWLLIIPLGVRPVLNNEQ